MCIRDRLWIAGKHPELNLDKQLLEEAAMLHDIGIFMTDAEGICCFGSYPCLLYTSLVNGTDYNKYVE